MKRLLSLLASVALLSSVGCCCLNSRVNECGPYGPDLAGGGGCLAKFARSHGAKKHCGCGHCGGGMYADPMYGMPYGMDAYGGGGCGCDGGMMGGLPGAGSPGCGCAGGGGMPQQMIPPAPPVQYAPQASPSPAPIAEPTPVPAVPESAAPEPPMTQLPAPTAPNVQNVSVEEFQRLPGTIISGPTTTSMAAPSPAASSGMATRQPVPTAAQPGVRPANWQPVQRAY